MIRENAGLVASVELVPLCFTMQAADSPTCDTRWNILAFCLDVLDWSTIAEKPSPMLFRLLSVYFVLHSVSERVDTIFSNADDAASFFYSVFNNLLYLNIIMKFYQELFREKYFSNFKLLILFDNNKM